MKKPLKVFIVAGEASGDILAARLMRALKDAQPDIEFSGVGGKRMAEEGLQSLFPMEELSVMGALEVLPRLPNILKRMSQTVSEVVARKPDALITIDSPDFCFRVAERVKAKDPSIPRIHYVAPSVWAWRPGRAKKVSKFLDHLLALLPFEPPYFEKYGLECTFVGHPIVERAQSRGDGQRFRQKHGLHARQRLITLLPGSRISELSRLLGRFSETASMVLHKDHDAVIAIPTLPHLKQYVCEFFAGKGINPIFVEGNEEKFDCFAASTAALAASGTVSLELALTDTPHVIAYRLSPLSAFLAKYLVKTPYVNLINILLRRRSVPELLQDDCEPDIMLRELMKLTSNSDIRAGQLTDFREALIRLGLGDTETPSQKAARAVLSVIARRQAAP